MDLQTGEQLVNQPFKTEDALKIYDILAGGAGTVSYTHLDVYKRQVPPDSGPGAGAGGRCGQYHAGSDCTIKRLTPVSYTHLRIWEVSTVEDADFYLQLMGDEPLVNPAAFDLILPSTCLLYTSTSASGLPGIRVLA